MNLSILYICIYFAQVTEINNFQIKSNHNSGGKITSFKCWALELFPDKDRLRVIKYMTNELYHIICLYFLYFQMYHLIFSHRILITMNTDSKL